MSDAFKRLMLFLFDSEDLNREARRLLRRLIVKLGNVDVKSFISSLIVKARIYGVWGNLKKLSKAFLKAILEAEIKFKNQTLLETLAKQVKELLKMLGSKIKYFLKGYRIAYQTCEVAQKWGNPNASKWIEEPSYSIIWGMFIDN